MRNITLTDVKQFAKRHDLYLAPAYKGGPFIFRPVKTHKTGSLVLTYVSDTTNGHKYFRVPNWRGVIEGCYKKAYTFHEFETYFYGEDL